MLFLQTIPFPRYRSSQGLNQFDCNPDDVLMIGLDFGSTTSRALIARSRIGRNRMTGYMGLGKPDIIFRATPVFTPFRDGRLKIEDILSCLEEWLQESDVDSETLFSGGVIITGLAASQENSAAIAKAVQAKINNLIVATTNDPGLESWLAFMGNTLELSSRSPKTTFINLDIGGGTTNTALGEGGNVLQTGCCQIGARHFQVYPGTYQIKSVSALGVQLGKYFNFSVEAGTTLSADDRDKVLSVFVDGLIALVQGDNRYFNSLPGSLFKQLPFNHSNDGSVAITYSGGVGELLYRHLAGEALPETTAYGDLGIDLVRKMLTSPVLTRDLKKHVPEYLGQSTVYGLAMHSAELSGHTVYLPDHALLPLHDLTVVARLRIDACEEVVAQALQLAKKCTSGSCIQVVSVDERYPQLTDIKRLGQYLAKQLKEQGFAEGSPLLLLAPQDFGKVLGCYATQWGRLPVTLLAVDEVPDRPVQFVSLGAVRNYVIPVYYYGMH